MLWLAVIAIGTVGSAVLTIWILPRQHAWRWGTVRGAPVEAGAGPYRDGSTQPDVPRGVPGIVRWAAGLGVAWGVLTLLAFTPAGFLLLLVFADGKVGLAGLLIPLLLVVLCDAFVLGFALVAIAPALLRGGLEGTRSARTVARWSTAHHFAVLAVFVLFPLASRDGVLLLLLAALPCLMGLAHAGMLDQAALACAARSGPITDSPDAEPHQSWARSERG